MPVNPLRWKPAHQLAGLSVCVIGGVIGTLIAWLQSPLYRVCQKAFFSRQPECRRALYGWIPKLSLYWPSSLFGILLFGMIFYLVMRRRLEK